MKHAAMRHRQGGAHPVETAFQAWRPGTPPAALSGALFQGALIVFSGLAPVARLARRARNLLCEALATADPPAAEAALDSAEFRRRALQARKIVAADATLANHWQATLAAIGYAPNAVWQDRLRLRVVPSAASPEHSDQRRLGALPPHRDTWGSGIAAQINWWLPLYPLAPTHTMLLWPDLFQRPLANDSGAWQFERARADKRYPLLPTAAERPAAAAAPALIEPGELLAFSAAHLHGGIADRSRRVRFSLDSRTVWEADRQRGRGAPDVDNRAFAQRWRWFAPPSASGAAA